jgi:hypothetical protein
MAQKDATTQTNSTEPEFDAVRQPREILSLTAAVSVTKAPHGVVGDPRPRRPALAMSRYPPRSATSRTT